MLKNGPNGKWPHFRNDGISKSPTIQACQSPSLEKQGIPQNIDGNLGLPGTTKNWSRSSAPNTDPSRVVTMERIYTGWLINMYPKVFLHNFCFNDNFDLKFRIQIEKMFKICLV